jgi:hypothetical protein
LQGLGTLAAELGARIIGVSASEHTPSFYFAAGAVETNLLAEDERRMKERMAAAEKRCREAREGCSDEASAIGPVDGKKPSFRHGVATECKRAASLAVVASPP